MPDQTVSLWPSDFGTILEPTPISILRQQGAALGEKTKNIVVGRVRTSGSGEIFYQQFSLYCAPLGYEVKLLHITHGVELYPAQINIVGESEPPLVANNADELREKLKHVFALPKTTKIVASLIKQSEE